MDNFRDVAGVEGYPLAGGGRMRRGVLYRSDRLDAATVDLARLTALGVNRLYDLRTDAEVEPKPDVVPDGAHYVRLDVLGTALDVEVLDLHRLGDAEGARELLIQVNRLFVRDETARARFGELIRGIAHSDGVHVFHCSAGKDRTGWATAIVHRILGVSHDDLLHDYLLTNVNAAPTINALAERATREHGEVIGATARALASVFPEAIGAGFDEAEQRYGGFDQYVRDGLGVDDATAERLREKLTT